MDFIPSKPRRILMSEESKTELLKYDTNVIKEGFNNWIDKWEWTFNEEGERVKGIIQQEFNSVVEDELNETVTIQKTESDNTLKFKFHTEFTFYITKEEKEEHDALEAHNKALEDAKKSAQKESTPAPEPEKAPEPIVKVDESKE